MYDATDHMKQEANEEVVNVDLSCIHLM